MIFFHLYALELLISYPLELLTPACPEDKKHHLENNILIDGFFFAKLNLFGAGYVYFFWDFVELLKNTNIVT